MTVYYYHGNPLVTPFVIESNQPVYHDDTVSLKHQRSSQKAQRWELAFNILSGDNIVQSFLGMLDEIDSTSTMIMPQFKEVDDKRTSVGSVLHSGALATSDSVTIQPNGVASGLIPRGSFISFQSHAKVYMTKNDIDLSSGSNQTLNIYPNLVETINGNSLNYGSDCLIRYYRDVNNVTNIRYQEGVLADPGTIKLIEAL